MSNRINKIRIINIMLAVMLILLFVSVNIQGAQMIKPLTKPFPEVKDSIPQDIQQIRTIEQYQLTYNDIWVWANDDWTNIYGKDKLIMIYVINTKFPSTITVQFSSEVSTLKTKCGDTAVLCDGALGMWVTIDDEPIRPGFVWFNSLLDWQTNSMTWYKSYMPAGSHKVKIYAYSMDTRSTLWYKTAVITANGYGH